MNQVQSSNQLDAKRREDVKNYIIQDIFNINLLTLSSFGAVDVDATVDKILDLQNMSGLGFVAFAKEKIEKIEFKSNYQRFFIVADRFILDAKKLIEKNRPKTNFELFSERLSKKVYGIASMLTREINRRDYELEASKRVDIFRLKELTEFEVQVVIGIGNSRASMLYRDNNQTLKALIELRDNNLLERAIEERVEIFIASIKSKQRRANNIFFKKSNELKEQLEKECINLEDSKKSLFKKVLPLLKSLEKSFIEATKNRKSISFSLVKKRDSSEAYFSDKELKVLEEIGILQVLSYVYNGSLDKAILDLIKTKDKDKNRKIARDRVYTLVRGGFRRAWNDPFNMYKLLLRYTQSKK